MAAKTQTETQEELEAPAKVYQFRELKDQLDRMEKGVGDLTTKLEQQTNTGVNIKYMEDRLVAMSTSFTDKLTNELKERDARMNSFEAVVNKNNKSMARFTWATISTALTIVATAVAIIYFTSLKP